MKKLFYGILCLMSVELQAQLGVGVEEPNASAMLEISSNTSGFLMPRVTQTQRNAILSPVRGLMVYQTDQTAGFYYHTGSAWTGPLTSSEVSGLLKIDGSTALSASLNMNSNKIINVGTPTNSNDLASKQYVDGFSGGLSWQASVVDLVSSAPVSPATGSRYILSAAWGGGSINNIATYSGSSWSFAAPSTKDAVYATVPSNGYVYNGSSWQKFSSGAVYNFTGGLLNTNNTITVDNGGVGTSNLTNNLVTAVKLNSMSASSGQILKYNGSAWAPAAANGGTVTSLSSSGSGLQVSNNSTTPSVSFTTVPVANGGTGTLNGSITGTTALTFAAGGTNQNVTLTPSGSGKTIVNGKLGLSGVTAPTTVLHLSNASTYSGSNTPVSNSIPVISLENLSNSSSSANASVLIQTGGNGGGNPYLSMDINGVGGTSVGVNNATDNLVINSRWAFSTSSTYDLISFIPTGQTRVKITDVSGNVKTDWPVGWGGGLGIWDLNVAGIYYNITSARSDRRLKNTIQPITSNLVLDKFYKIRPVSYVWNADVRPNRTVEYGVIAQEIEELFPEMISTADDSIQTKSVNYQSFVALEVVAIQQQRNDILQIKKENDEQLAKLAELKSLIQAKLK